MWVTFQVGAYAWVSCRWASVRSASTQVGICQGMEVGILQEGMSPVGILHVTTLVSHIPALRSHSFCLPLPLPPHIHTSCLHQAPILNLQ